jgi:hypothetical protein
MDRNTQRATFNGYYDATDFLCCPSCSCIPEDNADNQESRNQDECNDGCDPRLKKCENEICEICDDVKTTFCCTPEVTTPEKPVEVNHPKKSV